jgi:hypothetical protein
MVQDRIRTGHFRNCIFIYDYKAYGCSGRTTKPYIVNELSMALRDTLLFPLLFHLKCEPVHLFSFDSRTKISSPLHICSFFR